MENTNQFEGYVLFKLIHKDSKSEHYAPFLILQDNTVTELFHKGDNPFMNESLKPFHLKYCTLKGDFASKKNLIQVSEIKEIDDPVVVNWNKTNKTEEVTAKKEENHE